MYDASLAMALLDCLQIWHGFISSYRLNLKQRMPTKGMHFPWLGGGGARLPRLGRRLLKSFVLKFFSVKMYDLCE